jgi:hypothetical protein
VWVSEEGTEGGRERKKQGKGHTPTGPRRRPWCSSHAPSLARLLLRCLSSLAAAEEGGAAGWRQGGRRG